MEGGDQRRYRADRDHRLARFKGLSPLPHHQRRDGQDHGYLPCDDNGLNRLIKACFTVHCDGTVEVASRKTPAFVEWRRVWETQVAPHLPKGARVSVKGLSNALQCEAREYLTSFKNHLKYGLIALYARTLRAVDGLSKREAETTVARRLAGSPYFTLREARVFPDNTAADPDAPCIETHHDAFALLVRCLRAITATHGKNFHLAPIISSARLVGS